MSQVDGGSTDYSAQYNDYWTRDSRIGESSSNLDQAADKIVSSCGLGSALDIGSGEGALVAALLCRGMDAHGIDVSEVVVSRCNKRTPGRFTSGSVLSLPFSDDAFETLVSTDCLEHIAVEDVPTALREIHRVARRNVYLQIATTQDRDGHWHLTVEGRAWWEARCFEAGFRKHPAYYRLNDYEALNNDSWQICILLEKIPAIALAEYPLASLNEERGLHMDMTRDTGERSDAHIIRYQWACNYIKPGDRVLDAACGLGYGGHVVRHLTHAAEVVGIDGSDYAIDYARKAFPCAENRAEYYLGKLPAALTEFPDGSFDVIISFETLEHVEQPQKLLEAFYRLLTPGGRVIASIPNDWSDDSGEDPNPFHLHVYDWHRLKSELAANLILEDAFAQTASQCKVTEKGGVWERRPRSLRQVALSEHTNVDCEWWLMTAMKSPFDSKLPYEERVFSNIASTGHPSIRYSEFLQNPWLMHSIINAGCRLKNVEAREKIAMVVMASAPISEHDYAAALCVEAYGVLGRNCQGSPDADEIISKIDAVTTNPPTDPMDLRWRVSLLSIKAKLLQAQGHLAQAKNTFIECASHDVRSFGIHLATKTTEAWFAAGKLAYSLGDKEAARACWERGVESGAVLLSVSMDDILINRSYPNRFNHGDGVREYAVSWDNVARCANGLHLLKRGGQLDYAELDNCFQTEYATVTRDLLDCRVQLHEVQTRLIERTARLEQSNADLQDRTRDLIETRQLLIDRTERLERITKDNGNRIQEQPELQQDVSKSESLLKQLVKKMLRIN